MRGPSTPLTHAQRRRTSGGATCYRVRSHAWRGQGGLAALEFALILPFLLLLLGGMVEVSLMLYDQAVLANASREGARAGIVLRQPKLSDAEIEAVARNYAVGALVSLGAAADPAVTVEQDATPAFASPLRVTMTYDFSGFAAVGVLTALTGPVRLTATAVMNHE